MKLSTLFGTKRFYRNVLSIMIPMMIQNGVTNLVNLLDNIMVGRLSTEAMSGVSICNQFIFVFNLLLFGAVSAGGIFTAQYYGQGNTEGVRNTFRFKFLICLATGALGMIVFWFFKDPLIGIFLYDGSAEGNLEATLQFGRDYINVMIWGLIPYAVSQAYASTLRETGNAVPPVFASLAGVATNFVGNYILIFGNFGAPKLGVVGAAIATVASRFVEVIILIVWTQVNAEKAPFIVGAFRSLRIPADLIREISLRGLPLMANELLWSLSVTLRNQCYATRGLDVVAAQNIASTLSNLFNVVYLSIGGAVAVVLGNLLGAGKLKEAKRAAIRLQVFTIFCSVIMGGLLCCVSVVFPKIYNTTADVRAIATMMICIFGAMMPINASCNSAYFTIRSGGQVFVTMVLDSGFMWVLVMPLSFILSRFTDIPIFALFTICQGTEALKCCLGWYLLLQGKWVRKLVE